ncbi:MAG: hypothetical protein WCI73_19865 [Phycisphaerae bacterium]
MIRFTTRQVQATLGTARKALDLAQRIQAEVRHIQATDWLWR